MAVDDMATATHYTRLWTNKLDWTWGAADGMQSRLAPNGYTYWCFGDTIQGYPNPADASFDAARIMVSNTIVMQKGAELGPACWANGTACVPDVTMNAIPRRFWVTDIIFPSVYPTKAFALCQRIHDDMTLGWIVDGAYVAEFDVDGRGRLLFKAIHETPTSPLDSLDDSEIQWCQSWHELGGYIYVYGMNAPGIVSPFLTPQRTYVARVPSRLIMNKNAWQIWRGTGWVAGLTDTALENAKNQAAPILDGMATCVRYDEVNSRWLMVHKPFSGFGSSVEIYASTLPQGAFALKQTTSSPAGTSPGGNAYVTYNPTIHPKATLNSGQMLLSVSHNGVDFADIFDERNLYKPDWREISIPL